MYRGSRLAASFLLVMIGFAATAVAVAVAPRAGANPIGGWLAPAAIVFALGHWIALAGVARNRDWGRNLAVFLAELGGGLAILAAVSVVTGGRPFGAAAPDALAFAAWVGAVYAILGVAAGRVPVVARLTPIERVRVGLGSSFAGIGA